MLAGAERDQAALQVRSAPVVGERSIWLRLDGGDDVWVDGAVRSSAEHGLELVEREVLLQGARGCLGGNLDEGIAIDHHRWPIAALDRDVVCGCVGWAGRSAGCVHHRVLVSAFWFVGAVMIAKVSVLFCRCQAKARSFSVIRLRFLDLGFLDLGWSLLAALVGSGSSTRLASLMARFSRLTRSQFMRLTAPPPGETDRLVRCAGSERSCPARSSTCRRR